MSGNWSKADGDGTEETMTQKPLKAAGREFELVRRSPGYNRQEVDRFLLAVDERIQRLSAENSLLRSSIVGLESAAQQPPTQAQEPGRQEAERILARAGEQHAQDVEQGRARASELLEQASAQARELIEGAERLHAATMEELSAQEAELVRTGDRLQGFEQDYRQSLQGLMAEGLQEVVAVGDD